MKILLALLIAYSLFAGIYDEYEIQKTQGASKEKLSSFFQDDFKEIIRFDAIIFSDDSYSDEEINDINKTHYESVRDNITEYINKGEDIRLSIIGHAPSSQNLDEARSISKEHAQKIYNDFARDNIPKEMMSVEFRGDKDKAYTDATNNGKNRSSRVMVTMYVIIKNCK